MSKVYVLFEEREFGASEVIFIYRTLSKAIEDSNHFNENGKACYVEEFELVD
ncbi:hypothetical protein [Pseudomonas phage PP21]